MFLLLHDGYCLSRCQRYQKWSVELVILAEQMMPTVPLLSCYWLNSYLECRWCRWCRWCGLCRLCRLYHCCHVSCSTPVQSADDVDDADGANGADGADSVDCADCADSTTIVMLLAQVMFRVPMVPAVPTSFMVPTVPKVPSMCLVSQQFLQTDKWVQWVIAQPIVADGCLVWVYQTSITFQRVETSEKCSRSHLNSGLSDIGGLWGPL